MINASITGVISVGFSLLKVLPKGKVAWWKERQILKSESKLSNDMDADCEVLKTLC